MSGFQAAPTTSSKIRHSALQELQMYRLLIVDDALIMRKIIKDAAEQAGWLVVGEAKNGAEAVGLYESERPDLVTMDLVMPVMNGTEALRKIRAVHPDAQVVVVSALNQKDTLAETIRDGAFDFIVKPFERGDMIRFLEKMKLRLHTGESRVGPDFEAPADM
jgi:two-component system, chemotaxis family, chemotaxis protein CheY